MIAPIVPFVSENLYTKLTDEESVHLANFPQYDESLIDLKIEEKMDTVRDLISLGRKIREDVKIKVRQPIQEVILDQKLKSVIGDLTTLIEEELNVKQINFTKDLDEYINFEIKPNFKVCGKIFGSNVKALSDYLKDLDKETISNLEKGETITITLNKEEYTLTKDMLDIRVNSKEGYNTGVLNNLFIILNTTLNEDLINEGIARELISKVQQLRKTKDFNITDRIYIYYYTDIDLLKKLDKYLDFIKKETLCDMIIQEKIVDEISNLNGIDVYLDVKRV